ncbi:uncharacterized protein LOC116248337 isoform X2 [Nymphaea colorata]|uniref:uncharacterized protein LOC116248337 isoform X2 n=1 Tax=Nymphaea colorata TaxID=210225 RepID=UPI00214E1CB3|nr:uncharacterized protein LOC116248337 isoform X2 [Nymphaea colorata]
MTETSSDMLFKRVPWVLVCLYFHMVYGSNFDVLVTFQKAPLPITSLRSATFVFEVSLGAGGEPCTNCSIQCELDDRAPTNCEQNSVSYSGLGAGDHIFHVCINRSAQISCSSYNWTIDTVHPTASISTSRSFTNALNISAFITFNKPCLGEGGFRCSSVNDCSLLVYGPGQVVPSTLQVVQSDLKFSIVVSFSTAAQYGRVILAMRRGFCTDSAGNRFIRTANSTYTLHFDRRRVFANLTAHVPMKLLQLNAASRIVEATNDHRNLRIYLVFSVPVLNSSSEILSALHISSGLLVPINRKTLGNRRFGFLVNNTSSITIITITLQQDAIISRQGTFVSPTEPLTFLYDCQRPTVRLTTTSEKRTRDHYLPCRFSPISWSLYGIDVHVDDSTVSVEIPANITGDIAGNKNLASNVLQVMHYSVPTTSVAISTLTTAAFAVTSLAAGLLTVSTASLQSFGALSNPLPSYVTYDPSRNLFRIAGHIQVFALSKWLPVTLPVEYYEFVRGLQWSIPHLRLPWEAEHYKTFPINSSSHVHPPVKVVEERSYSGYAFKRDSQLTKHLTAMEYASLFEIQNMKPEAEFLMSGKTSTGWKEFKRNMFWLVVIVGSLMLLHAIIVFTLKLKRRSMSPKHASYGALVVPRFELFLIILALPCMCQAGAAVIKGGSAPEVIVGVLLVGFSSLCVLSLLSFLTIGITMGKLLQYKEVHQEGQKFHWYQELIRITLGPGKRGQWTWKNQPLSVKLTMFGPLFEDLRGPPKYMLSQIVGEKSEKKSDQIIASDDETEDAEAPFIQKLFGILRIYYIMLELIKRVSLGITVGAYSSFSQCKFPVIFIFCITSFQLIFMVMKKPFIRKMVQFVEIIAVATEAAVFATCIVLLERDLTVSNDKALGLFMVLMFSIGFIVQIISEWRALFKQVLRLSSDGHSFCNGLKMVSTGLLLILIPWKLLNKWDSQLFSNDKSGENVANFGNQTSVPAIGVVGDTPVRQSRSSSTSDRPWMKQLRELAKASFSREGSGTQTDPSSSQNQRNMGRSQSPTGLYRDLEAIFSSASR